MSASEVRALRAELEALRLTVTSQGERIEELESQVKLLAAQEEEEFAVVGSESSRPVEPGLISSADKSGRARLAKECGQFLARAVAGTYRGSSGREKLKLANRIYVVLADFTGKKRTTPLVTDSFAEVKELCKRGSSCGASIFLGSATQWEAQLAVEEAGYTWPLGQ